MVNCNLMKSEDLPIHFFLAAKFSLHETYLLNVFHHIHCPSVKDKYFYVFRLQHSTVWGGYVEFVGTVFAYMRDIIKLKYYRTFTWITQIVHSNAHFNPLKGVFRDRPLMITEIKHFQFTEIKKKHFCVLFEFSQKGMS